MRRPWRRLRGLGPLAVAYGLVLLFLTGLMVNRQPGRPEWAAEPAIPAMGGFGGPGGGDHTGSVSPRRTPPLLQLFRPDPATARSLLGAAIPMFDLFMSRGLVLYGEVAVTPPEPQDVFQVMFPFLRGRTAKPLPRWPVVSRSGGRAVPPGAVGAEEAAAAVEESRGFVAPLPVLPFTATPPGPACRDGDVSPVAGGQPLVAIYHTHDHESYISEFPTLDPEKQPDWSKIQTLDPERNIIRVGARLASALCRRGVSVIHSTDRHAATYLGAYLESRKTAQKILKDYPTVQVLIDVHRDAQIGRTAAAAQVADLPVARVMFIVGKGKEGDRQPRYSKNLAWAELVHRTVEGRYPGLSRGVRSQGDWYNQDLRPGALLIEVGSVENSMEEALRTADLLAAALVDLIRQNLHPH